MRELETLLPLLEPPPGGLARLQQKIAKRRHPSEQVSGRSHRRTWNTALAAMVATAICVALVPHWVLQRRQTAMIAAALRRDVLPVNGIRVLNGAAIELPSGQPDVRLYLVQSVADTHQNDMK
ncbi:MAG TPA: hypothetical protein VN693_03670 [Rhodanobacteraceae bacterium]|nr:hypothetical protein [Rhodanobacteraceae bacterium]